MASVVILGAGVMGTAFSVPLADAGWEVHLVGTPLDDEQITAMRSGRAHPGLGVRVPATVTLSHDSGFAALPANVELVVLGVSSAGVDWAIERLRGLLSTPVPLLMLTKGLAVERGSFIVLPDKVRRALAADGLDGLAVGGIGGPCIAGELAVRRDTSVVVSFTARETVARFRSLLSTSYYHVVGSTNPVGVEACAALKNLYAIAVGAAQGQLELLGKGVNGAGAHNLASGLFTQALLEMAAMERALCGRSEAASGLAGVGDLHVTCQAGRNSRMGRLLGLGLRYSEAKRKYMTEETVEGAELAAAIGTTFRKMVREGRLAAAEFPLAEAVVAAVCDDASLDFPWKRFYR